MRATLSTESAAPLIAARDEAELLALCEGPCQHVARRWEEIGEHGDLDGEDLRQVARLAALDRVRRWIAAGHGPSAVKPSTEICRYAERDIRRAVARALGCGERVVMARGWLRRQGLSDLQAIMARRDRPNYMRARSVVVAALRLDSSVGTVTLDPEREVVADSPEDLGSALALADELLAKAGLSREDALPLLAACGLAEGERDPAAARRVAAMIRRACRPAPVLPMPVRVQPQAPLQPSLWAEVA